LRELNAELANVKVSDPKQRKAAQDAALDSIIARKALAKAARDQGIDKTADFALQRERTEEALLAEALQNKFASAVPAPARDEVSRFVIDHPELFAQRKIFVVEQIRMQRPNDANLVKQLEPLNTLDEIVNLLQSQHVQFSRGDAELDSAALGPQLTGAILKLPPDAVFVLPSGSLMLISQIKGTRIEPLPHDTAVNVATEYLRRQQLQEAVSRETRAILEQAKATLQFNPQYKPSPAPVSPLMAAPPSAPTSSAAPAPSPTPAPASSAPANAAGQ
jgi:EpsD family peptidyl-prolyl cis-trans isomerase